MRVIEPPRLVLAGAGNRRTEPVTTVDCQKTSSDPDRGGAGGYYRPSHHPMPHLHLR
ncbi:hypothetical protein A2U01_0062786, partial [Trifolium medium]|nr:hypothetical protein [Trifolium medium]